MWMLIQSKGVKTQSMGNLWPADCFLALPKDCKNWVEKFKFIILWFNEFRMMFLTDNKDIPQHIDPQY